MISLDRTTSYLFLVVAMLAVVGICIRPDIHGLLYYAALCFATSIPLLLLSVMMGLVDDETLGKSFVGTITYNAFKVFGILLTLAGFGFLLANAATSLGITFAVMMVSLILFHKLWWRIVFEN